MAGVSAYAAEAQTVLAPAPGGSTRRLQSFVRAEGKFDLHFYITDHVIMCREQRRNS
jgi:hypothetical protein